MKCISGNITRRKPNFAVKDVLIDTKYSLIAENLPLCPIIFIRDDLVPLGTGYIGFPTVYNLVTRHYDVIMTLQVCFERFS